MLIVPPPAATDYGFYSGYIAKAPTTDLIAALKDNWSDIKKLADSLNEEQLLLRYEPGKWSIKEVLVHLIDAERNFCYRIMRISRGDQAQLPAFSIHEFVANSYATERDIENIMLELELLRKSTIAMFEGMHPSMLDLTGPARDVTISVRALGFALVGHGIHHIAIIRDRYLAAV